MLKVFEYRLYPNKEQQVILAKHFGCNRFIYNWALAKKIEAYEKENKTLSKYDLNKMVTELKKEKDREWLNEVNAQSLQQSVQNLETAYINFFRNKKGFPRFKSKKTNRHTFKIPQNVKIDYENKRIFLVKIGYVKLKIDRIIQGEIKSATVKQVPSGKYFVSVLVEDGICEPDTKELNKDKAIGIDLGLKHFAILSNGTKIENPKALKKHLAKLKILQKRLSKKEKGSNNRNKARIKVAKQHEKIANIRKDFLQKLSTQIINDSQIDTICLETLNISGMLQNHKLAQAISDVSWYEFVRMLEYKANWQGKNILRIGRFEPSSKLCTCGYINNNLTLSDRVWECPICHKMHDRDLLASQNIKNIAFSDLNKKYHNSGLGKSVELAEVLA